MLLCETWFLNLNMSFFGLSIESEYKERLRRREVQH